MATRKAEIKAYVLPEIKEQAAALYAHWGMSLSDAINSFLVKSIDVGGMPFDLRMDPRPAYNRSGVLEIDPEFGSSVLPAEMDDEEDGLYDHLVK